MPTVISTVSFPSYVTSSNPNVVLTVYDGNPNAGRVYLTRNNPTLSNNNDNVCRCIFSDIGISDITSFREYPVVVVESDWYLTATWISNSNFSGCYNATLSSGTLFFAPRPKNLYAYTENNSTKWVPAIPTADNANAIVWDDYCIQNDTYYINVSDSMQLQTYNVSTDSFATFYYDYM